ncbi:MAG: hypothetical protein K8F52_05730 [Candidatus Scalindua rubra]|uniref:Uncharacterized protein n=1 Tax=Candidatus Scalindua brodae TaxID=237368 RepID=A0A0B0EQM4_9BACT|nr:MAG: hypothetical protein SCABRO_00864 [Candidatus Scalindua brodae]MBZ0108148.1 hypothetical protein [Candidatus Scalindua rubra]TWU31234.1 hypothetical protein S225a_21800 [Candidatus Brocadiaceae bacterium S225]
MKKDKSQKRSDEQRILNFLQRTKEGKYAKIEQSSLSFVRVREKSEPVDPSPEESFYYSVS